MLFEIDFTYQKPEEDNKKQGKETRKGGNAYSVVSCDAERYNWTDYREQGAETTVTCLGARSLS